MLGEHVEVEDLIGVILEPGQAPRSVIGGDACCYRERLVDRVPLGLRAQLLLREREHRLVDIDYRSCHRPALLDA
jgi:hypothetical protein